MVFKMLEETDGDVSSEKVLAAAKAIDEPEGTTAAGWGIKFDENGYKNERAETMSPNGLTENENSSGQNL